VATQQICSTNGAGMLNKKTPCGACAMPHVVSHMFFLGSRSGLGVVPSGSILGG
jgi:hypothetical protein